MPDLKKFQSPPQAGEVTEGLLNVRLSMHQFFTMISAARIGNWTEFDDAQKKYLELDSKLQKIINRVGGFDGPK